MFLFMYETFSLHLYECFLLLLLLSFQITGPRTTTAQARSGTLCAEAAASTTWSAVNAPCRALRWATPCPAAGTPSMSVTLASSIKVCRTLRTQVLLSDEWFTNHSVSLKTVNTSRLLVITSQPEGCAKQVQSWVRLQVCEVIFAYYHDCFHKFTFDALLTSLFMKTC